MVFKGLLVKRPHLLAPYTSPHVLALYTMALTLTVVYTWMCLHCSQCGIRGVQMTCRDQERQTFCIKNALRIIVAFVCLIL